jgi:predicted nucleotidyltransferase
MKIEAVLTQLKEQLQAIYGERLKEVVLYGSWARNEGTDDSDIDIAVVLDGDVKPGAEIDRLINMITDMNLQHRVLISVYPVSARDFSTIRSPLLINLRREGQRI